MRLMKTPKSVDIEITTKCNLRCRYCSHFGSGSDVPEDLPTSEWLQFFEELGRCAVMDLCLQGGEPFMREDFKQLVQGIVKNRMRFSILSNGTLIDDELATFLVSTKRCTSIQVSIDGSVDTSHDAFRGKGSFFKAVAGLRTLLKHRVPATVRVTIHRRNVKELDEIAVLLLDDIGLPSFSTNAASHLGLCQKNEEQVQLTSEERTLAMQSLLRLTKKYDGRINAQAGPLAEARAWRNMVKAHADGTPGSPTQGKLTGCGGPMNKLAVLADGTIVPCNLLPNMTLGKINRDDLRELWQNHPELNRFRQRRDIPLGNFDYCRDCPYIDHCTGNCPALSDAMLRDAYQPSPDACLRRFLDSGGQLPDIADG